MKRILKYMLVGITLVNAVQRVEAQQWVQTFNLALVAQVQTTAGTVKRVAIPSKEIIALLSAITAGTNLTLVTNSETLTNTVDNPLPLPQSPFAASPVLTSYFVNINGVTFSNRVDFTNDITFTRTSISPVTYTFHNAVTVGTNGTGFLIPDFHTDPLTAVLVSSNGPAYTITGVSTNIPPSTRAFSPTAKLLVIRDVLGGTDTFIVRDGKKPTIIDTDVTAFFGLGTFLTVTQNHPNGGFTDYSHINLTFDNTAGGLSTAPNPTSFNLDGLSTQVSSTLKVRGTDFGAIRRSFGATVLGSGQSGIPGTSGPMVLSGRVTISGGTFVAAAP